MTSTPSHWTRQAAEAAARRIGSTGRTATFETGYGPSGAPHMGTVAEVLRTAMVARAFREVTGGAPLRLVSVTDDMDGLRRVPEGEAGRDRLATYLGAPLCDIPAPEGGGSFAARNAALLRGHLRRFGLRAVEPAESLARLLAGEPTDADEVLCVMASDLYRGGHHDAVLRRVAARASEIAAVVGPELGAERRATWCPFVPLHRGRMVTDTRDWSIEGEALAWTDAKGERHLTPVLGGGAKLQWRVDWSARWVALGVDFEMHGKDLADSVRLGNRIAPLLGGRAPVTYQYELFLDEDGAKMSKSVGNGVGLEEWERHAPAGAFRHFLARDPRRARRVGRATLPQAVDEWLAALRDPADPSADARLAHPEGLPPVASRLGFATVLAVAALADADGPEAVWRLLEGYDPEGVNRGDPLLGDLVRCAVARHVDIGRPSRRYLDPDEDGRAALADLAATLRACPEGADAEAVQFQVYEAGKRHGGKEGLRDFFRLVYGALLGEESGPRVGTLAEAVGRDYLVDLIETRLGRAAPRLG